MINLRGLEGCHRLHIFIRGQGYHLSTDNGVTVADNEAEVQALIDSYNPLPESKIEAKARIKQHAATLIHAIYPHIDPVTSDVIGFYNYTIDIWGGGQLPARLLELKAVRDVAVAKIAEVDVMSDWQLVDDYNATEGW